MNEYYYVLQDGHPHSGISHLTGDPQSLHGGFDGSSGPGSGGEAGPVNLTCPRPPSSHDPQRNNGLDSSK